MVIIVISRFRLARASSAAWEVRRQARSGLNVTIFLAGGDFDAVEARLRDLRRQLFVVVRAEKLCECTELVASLRLVRGEQAFQGKVAEATAASEPRRRTDDGRSWALRAAWSRFLNSAADRIERRRQRQTFNGTGAKPVFGNPKYQNPTPILRHPISGCPANSFRD